MNRFEPLDWIHQWNDFEMMMYAVADGEDSGIFMQTSHREMRDGAEEWEVLYDRKLSDLNFQTDEEPGSDPWQEAVLRHHLNTHPQLVHDEKEYIQGWLHSHSE